MANSPVCFDQFGFEKMIRIFYQLSRTKFTFFILLVLIQTGCRDRQNLEKNTFDADISDGNFKILFNGETLDGWEITNFGPQGPVYTVNGKIILGMGDGCTGITWKNDFPEMNYEVNLEAMRVDGNDFFCGMTFPVKKSFCTLIVGGWGGLIVGLSCIDGLDASENSTTKIIKFDENTWYHIHLKVTGNTINAWINDINVVDFEIGDHKLSLRAEVGLSKPFGIATWKTTAAFRNISIRKYESSKI